MSAPVETVQEPVAWRYTDAQGHYRYRGYVPNFDVEYKLLKPQALCLCTTPPAAQPAPKKWQSITEEEYSVLRNAVMLHSKPLGWIVDAVETILKEKNHGN